MLLRTRIHRIEFPRRPLVMGIVNINDDSFCGDGSLDVSASLALAREQLCAGADVIDVGAESARTNRGAISVQEEVQRLAPFLAAWPALVQSFATAPWDAQQVWPPVLSINTWRSAVVEQVLPLGGDLLNDMSALPTARNAELCALHGVALLIMHSRGEPKVPHTHVQYADVMQELLEFFPTRMALAKQAGMQEDQLLLDPGIDFAKQREDNLTVYRELEKLHLFQRPLLLPVSRKTVIGQVLGQSDPLERDAGTVACLAAGMARGAQLFRVHNVAAAAEAVKVLWGLR